MGYLDQDDIALLAQAEISAPRTPIPTQIVSSDEYRPTPQTPAQAQVEARLMAMGEDLARRQGMSRRRFFQTAAGMAAGFVALNEVFGPLFEASHAEAATPEQANERAQGLRGQFIMDMHTHFLRDDTRLTQFANMREAVRGYGWNPQLRDKQTIEDLKFHNYFKEIFLDSDTKIALISSAPSEIRRDWFLTNAQMAAAREQVNKANNPGGKRLFSHAIFTPGMDGWLDELDASIALKPNSMKGYTIGDNTHKDLSRHPWRMDDEKVTYRGYEKMLKAGQKIVCVHKGLFARSEDAKYPHLTEYASCADVGKAAKDWPELTFVIYHSGYRLGPPDDALAEFDRTGRLEWVSDLADVPAKYGVTNVYGDLGQVFANTMIAQPRVCAAIVGTLVKGLGADHVVWGTDAVWTGSPQWQIEGLRRLEIPEDMRAKHGFPALGPADGPTKRAIFGGNNARLYKIDPAHIASLGGDRFASLKTEYDRQGPTPSLRRYGYMARS